MKRMAAVLAALGISSAAAYADSPSTNWEQSYDVTRMEEPAYGYSMNDPYSDAYSDEYVVEEYILVPSDTVVLVPLEDEEG
jgi:hypothetical protein